MTTAGQIRAVRGFTLIEVLAALLLVGIVLPAVMEGISLANQAGRIAKTKLEATALAESKLNEIVASGQWNISAGSGDFAPDYPDYRWAVQVQDRDYNVSEVDVMVTWMVRETPRSVTVSTLVYNIANAVNSGTSAAGSSTGSTGTTGTQTR